MPDFRVLFSEKLRTYTPPPPIPTPHTGSQKFQGVGGFERGKCLNYYVIGD